VKPHHRPLLLFGLLAAIAYPIADIVGGLAWRSYSYASQGVSELMAVGTQSRAAVLAIMTGHAIFLLIFAVGLWLAAEGRRAERLVAIFLAADAIIGWVTPVFFPVEARGVIGGSGLSVHLVLTTANVLAILLAIGFTGIAYGGRFRWYSFATIVVMLVFAALSASQAARIAAGEPTPFLGITERGSIYAYMIWLAALAVLKLRWFESRYRAHREREEERAGERV
jgi:hypothetical protein